MTRKRYPAAEFIGTMAQMVPTAYVVVTGTVPLWARITLGTWSSLWLLLVLAKGMAAEA